MSDAHTKAIAKAAKATLHPLGLRQKGQSRLWIGDNGWWLGIVEFQPSGFSKGSYLNVAAHWLWSDQGHISFDLGSGPDWDSRVADFEACEPGEPFDEAAGRLASVAAQSFSALAGRLPSIEETADVLLSREANSSAAAGSWSTYHAGVAAGLAGRSNEANAMLHSITDTRVRGAAERYRGLTSDAGRFRAMTVSLIETQREALRLPAARAALF